MANDSRRARRSFAKCCRPACWRKVRAKRDISNPTEPDLASCLVYIDANKNGRYDNGEIFARTNAGGDFTLALTAAGHYRVAVALPSGYTHTSAAYFDLTIHTHAQAIARFALTQIDLNDTIAEAKAAGLQKLNKTFAGSLTSSTDVNMYSFSVKAGQSLLITADRVTGSSLKSYLRLFTATGSLLAANNNGIGPTGESHLDSFLRYTFTKTGITLLMRPV